MILQRVAQAPVLFTNRFWIVVATERNINYGPSAHRERIKLRAVCIRQLYFNVNFRRSGRRFINSPLFWTRSAGAINSVSTGRL